MENTPVTIVVGNTGLTVSPSPDVRGGNEELSKGEQPATLPNPTATLPDVPTPAEQTDKIRQLTNKSVLCAMERLNDMMTNGATAAAIEQWTGVTLKLLDAREAYLWADAFRAAVLKNPKLMSPNGKGLGPKGLDARSNGAILNRIDRGDTRTTPKRLIASMPADDSPTSLTG